MLTKGVETMKTKTDVLIVGAGPTGLALATALQRAGIDHLLIDRLEAGLNLSRAGVVHAHTLEMLEPLGVVPQMLAAGLKMTRFAVRDRRHRLMSIDFDRLPSRYPFVLMLPQDVTERILTDRLAALGGRVHRGVEALDLAQDADGVTVRVTTGSGERTIRARYVVGGDGMHSKVREASGIAFEGGRYEESFVLADVSFAVPPREQEVSLFFSTAGMVVVAPLPGGRHRIVATHRHEGERPDRAAIQHLLDTRGPQRGGPAVVPVVAEVHWSSAFRVHHRVADTYRDGRLLVMGDAAHVHSPAGGQGMNTGIVDAMLLAPLLARVVRGAPESLLDAYGARRRPAAEAVLGLAGRLTKLALVRGRVRRGVRNLLLRALDRVPPFKAKLALQLSGIARRELAVAPGGDAGPAGEGDATGWRLAA
ncbi:MAG: FAD-dependent monooxygenase [Sphingopyxis sp.]|nr:FAD-dependent monooxygenase [Sphingopyxis sp.]